MPQESQRASSVSSVRRLFRLPLLSANGRGACGSDMNISDPDLPWEEGRGVRPVEGSACAKSEKNPSGHTPPAAKQVDRGRRESTAAHGVAGC